MNITSTQSTPHILVSCCTKIFPFLLDSWYGGFALVVVGGGCDASVVHESHVRHDLRTPFGRVVVVGLHHLTHE